MAYGRPMKNGTRRVPVTLHIPIGMLETIDDYVADYAQTSGTEAAVAFRQSKGIDPEGERNKSVTRKPTVNPNEDNINN